jgi:P22_AR N-terminal domain
MPVRALCLYLGIASQMQIKALRKSRSMSPYLRRFTLTSPSGGGRQAQWCLHIRALAFWLAGHIDAEQVRPELQEGLLEWQDTLIHAAHELFFGPIHEEPEELDYQALVQRLKLAEFEIRRLKLAIRLHSRRLGTVERFTLPETYFDTSDDEPE